MPTYAWLGSHLRFRPIVHRSVYAKPIKSLSGFEGRMREPEERSIPTDYGRPAAGFRGHENKIRICQERCAGRLQSATFTIGWSNSEAWLGGRGQTALSTPSFEIRHSFRIDPPYSRRQSVQPYALGTRDHVDRTRIARLRNGPPRRSKLDVASSF